MIVNFTKSDDILFILFGRKDVQENEERVLVLLKKETLALCSGEQNASFMGHVLTPSWAGASSLTPRVLERRRGYWKEEVVKLVESVPHFEGYYYLVTTLSGLRGKSALPQLEELKSDFREALIKALTYDTYAPRIVR